MVNECTVAHIEVMERPDCVVCGDRLGTGWADWSPQDATPQDASPEEWAARQPQDAR